MAVRFERTGCAAARFERTGGRSRRAAFRRIFGCRKLANAYPNEVHRYAAAHDRYTTDMDTPDDYERICRRFAERERITA